MKSLLILLVFISSLSPVMAERSPVTFLGAFHDEKSEEIVFSVHYLRGEKDRERISGGAYIRLNGKKYPIHASDIMICGSHTAGRNCIEEYSIRGYKVLGDDSEIPGLRSLTNVVFGYDFVVNGKRIHFEKIVKFTEYQKQAEQVEQVAAPDS